MVSSLAVLQGYEPILASPKGGKVPIDPNSVKEQFLTATSKDFLKDGEHIKMMSLQADYTPIDYITPVMSVGTSACESMQ